MATFNIIKEPYLSPDGDWYKIDGILTEEDIIKINSFPRKSNIIRIK